jgi:carboxymethylenebutenolidase
MPISQEVLYECRDAFRMPAHINRPQSGGAFPGIVFVYEAFGMNSEMTRVAAEIASAGYVVMIPDLFSRGSWFACIRRLVKELAAEGGRNVDDLLAAREWLRHQSFVDRERIGVLGLCIGGGFAMVLAKTGLFQVAAPFYGPVPKSLAGACPMVASFGAQDKIMAPGAAAVKAELERLQVPNDVKVYPGVGHGFMTRLPNRVMAAACRYSPLHVRFDKMAADDAMSRLLKFLAAHL